MITGIPRSADDAPRGLRHGSIAHSIARRWRDRRAAIVRLVRYSAVSGVATATSLGTLGLMVGVLGLPAAWSNVAATVVGTVPSFELNRRWVWSSRTRRSLTRQVLPFCALSLGGLLASTLAVAVVGAHTGGWGRWRHTLAVEGANVASYGTLWVVQYQLLRRVLFGGWGETGAAARTGVHRADPPVPEPTVVAVPTIPQSPAGSRALSSVGAGSPTPSVGARRRRPEP